MDDDKAQDPFFLFRYFNINSKAYDKENDKVKLDDTKPLMKYTCNPLKCAGKEFEWKDNLTIDIDLSLKQSEDGKKYFVTEKKENSIYYFNIHLQDKDYFTTSTIGRCFIDLGLFVLDSDRVLLKAGTNLD